MKKPIVQENLKKIPLFKELSDTEIDHIASISSAKIYNAGSYVFMQDEPLATVYFIESGKVKIYKTDIHGKEQIVSILEAGEMFPHAGFFRGGSYPANSEIMKKARLICIPIHSFEKILVEQPELCVKLFRVLGSKIIDLHDRLEEQILHNTFEQVLMLLIRLSRTNGQPHGAGEFKLTSTFTNRELANMIGTSRETVSRTLTQLRKKGVLKVSDEGLFIINQEKLEEEMIS
ncbi:Crp/Fnr family transcriptional regulator [Halobacillus sp. Marseille-Q1614]|uniref:Crp/Fnr family transcriptional regulator n=1 Tax=Halobacillus sp. Marseille-Q1614 TaxID=2709134 RepID=UPI0015710381|nr:Crp/Fnr family transcriptional regulator [Halobacillus sp. Marseille-Q1614]